MRRLLALLSLPVVLLVPVPPIWGQVASPAPPNACEQQVQDQYRTLSADGLVPQATAAQWGPQLTAIASQLRVQRNLYELKKNQAELAEQRWLQTNEELRLLQQRLKPDEARPGAGGAPAN
jgi:hypothetical protein